ncbi:hypothetical protein LIA77_04357 [Sarocladium implicatum]|nr:hypothetical protein LIA77_04357 [Sarocladium implicatum]
MLVHHVWGSMWHDDPYGCLSSRAVTQMSRLTKEHTGRRSFSCVDISYGSCPQKGLSNPEARQTPSAACRARVRAGIREVSPVTDQGRRRAGLAPGSPSLNLAHERLPLTRTRGDTFRSYDCTGPQILLRLACHAKSTLSWVSGLSIPKLPLGCSARVARALLHNKRARKLGAASACRLAMKDPSIVIPPSHESPPRVHLMAVMAHLVKTKKRTCDGRASLRDRLPAQVVAMVSDRPKNRLRKTLTSLSGQGPCRFGYRLDNEYPLTWCWRRGSPAF